MASNLLQIFLFELQPIKIDGKYRFVVVNQSRYDRDDSIEVALFRNGGCGLWPEQGWSKHDGDVEGGHLGHLAILRELVQKLKKVKK